MKKLGQGAMGVVYQAEDPRLGRFVAIKFLSEELSDDQQALERFQREARAVSALNHPNICTVHEVGEHEDVPFIVMEYVTGKSLDQLIGPEGLPVNKVLNYAVQITDALVRAHSAGIIHRDLKPANIMVNQDGFVKLLDFGLAKVRSAGPIAGLPTPARTPPLTGEGTILGTLQYMSPEQLEGKEADARTDIFALGAVIYEMVTGRRAFEGKSHASLIAAILGQHPPQISALQPATPPAMEYLVQTCLAKDPKDRWQTARDLIQELKWIADAGLQARIPKPVVSRRNSRELLSWVLTAAVSLALLTVAVVHFRERVTDLAEVYFRVLRPASRATLKTVPLTSYPGWQHDPAFSPDGKQIAFSWDGEKENNFDIYVKLVGAESTLRLTTNPAAESLPAWSPDGTSIAFCRDLGNHSGIFIVPALGGMERMVAQTQPSRESGARYWPASVRRGLSWSPDGKSLAIADSSSPQGVSGIFLLSMASGEKRKMTSPPDGYLGDCFPKFSPDGRAVAFIRLVNNSAAGDLYVLPIAQGGPKGETRRVTFDERWIFGLDWTEDGRNLVFSSNRSGGRSLWMVSAAGGIPRQLAVTGENATALSVARTGHRLAYERGVEHLNIWRIPGPNSADKGSPPPLKFISSKQMDASPKYSPDGRSILFQPARSGDLETWVCDSDGRNPVQLTSFGGVQLGSARWSPDSRWIAFDSTKEGNADIYVISVGGGRVRRVTTDPSNEVRPSWSGDGRWIYFGSDRTGGWQIWKVPVHGGAAVQVTKRGGRDSIESADGKFVYYAKLGTPGIWRVPVAGGQEIQILDQGWMGGWDLTSQGICFREPKEDNGSARPAIKFYSFENRHVSTIREFSTDMTILNSINNPLSISPDGRWILYTKIDQAGTDLMLVENFR